MSGQQPPTSEQSKDNSVYAFYLTQAEILEVWDAIRSRKRALGECTPAGRILSQIEQKLTAPAPKGEVLPI